MEKNEKDTHQMTKFKTPCLYTLDINSSLFYIPYIVGINQKFCICCFNIK